MKIIYIDTILRGHHKSYLEILTLQNLNHEMLAILPSTLSGVKTYVIPFENKGDSITGFYFIRYIYWMNKIKRIIEEENPDVVHFIYGDFFYRYFGIGLSWLKKYKIIMTFHHIRRSYFRDISLKRIFKLISNGVVHTDSLYYDMQQIGIKNIEHIKYPHMGLQIKESQAEAQSTLRFTADGRKVLLALGGTRKDKGLDILLDALKQITIPFHLLIAGQENDFDRKYIETNLGSYISQTTMILKFLSDEEFERCILAADFIVLPYRRGFDGASGPLIEGVARGKIVIGPEHGSIGQTIKNYHLGYIFKTEDVDSLAKTICDALNKSFIPDETYRAYQKCLDPKTFIEAHSKLYN
ncbi:glycosyltransferase family 4 protein [Pelosinus sp. sgz500959]|uniref:glycosyltransferase family 4 protein n=1 Tax=Pelosinus sp. sgz500959 TaxID=3242472 RepID=UPI003671F793